jgi:hypothetical protein
MVQPIDPLTAPAQIASALREIRPATKEDADALRWAIEVLSAPIDNVRPFDPRWDTLKHRVLSAIPSKLADERHIFALMRAISTLSDNLGPDAQRTRGPLLDAASARRADEEHDADR